MDLEAMDVLATLVQLSEHRQGAKIASDPRMLQEALTTFLTGRLNSKREAQRLDPDSQEAADQTDAELEAEETVMAWQNRLNAEQRRNLWEVYGKIHPDAMAYIP